MPFYKVVGKKKQREEEYGISTEESGRTVGRWH